MFISEGHCFTSFIDILGISDLIERNLPNARDKLSLFHDYIRRFLDDSPKGLSKSIIFSDSVILVWNDVNHAIDGCASLFSLVFDANSDLLRQYSMEQFMYRAILLRGAISEGSLEIEDGETSGSSERWFIIGSALSRSAKGETLVKGSRLILLGNWASEKNILLDEIELNPKGRVGREILWPLARCGGINVESFKWILNLCHLYKSNNAISVHYRDTFWVLLRSAINNEDERFFIQAINSIEQLNLIDWENPFWAPIILCIIEGFIKFPKIMEILSLTFSQLKKGLISAELKLMGNI